jgi:hypothetical protein
VKVANTYLGQAVVAAPVPDQRDGVLLQAAELDDLANEDRVVAAIVDRDKATVDKREALRQDWTASDRRGVPFDAIKLVLPGRAATGGEPNRQLDLVSREHRHRKYPGPREQLVHPSSAVDADEHEQRVQGHRRERVRGHPMEDPAHGGRHDGHSGRKAGQRAAELLRRDLARHPALVSQSCEQVVLPLWHVDIAAMANEPLFPKYLAKQLLGDVEEE